MPFTEFCCRSGGSNLNAGTRKGDNTVPATTPNFTYTGGTWVSSTGVFTVASGHPFADGVEVGDFASVCDDAATTTTLVGRVTARTSTTITVSTTEKSGTTTDGTNNRTLRIGGAWSGPAAASQFPFSLLTLNATNTAGDLPRVNLSGSYSITAAITPQTAVSLSGYGTGYDDGARASIDGGTGTGFTMLNVSGNRCQITDLVFANNGGSGSLDIVSGGGNTPYFRRVTVSGARRTGFNVSSPDAIFIECEAYDCGLAGAANAAGFGLSGSATYLRCAAYKNDAAATQHGFDNIGSTATYIDCIAAENSGCGINLRSTTFAKQITIIGCDFYKNDSGIKFATTILGLPLYVENCNFVDNTTSGIEATGSNAPVMRGLIVNSGLGSGTQANGSNFIGIGSEYIIGSVTYAADLTPWFDPDNGNFQIVLPAAQAAGRGAFLQTQVGYGGTIGYPDIGAAQSQGGGPSRPVNPFTQQVIG